MVNIVLEMCFRIAQRYEQVCVSSWSLADVVSVSPSRVTPRDGAPGAVWPGPPDRSRAHGPGAPLRTPAPASVQLPRVSGAGEHHHTVGQDRLGGEHPGSAWRLTHWWWWWWRGAPGGQRQATEPAGVHRRLRAALPGKGVRYRS